MIEEFGVPRIDDNKIDLFLRDVRRGVETSSAFWGNGIPASVGMEALAVGKIASTKARPLKREAPMIKLWYAYSSAITDLHRNLISSIKTSEDWKAHRYLLEASAPESYGAESTDPNTPSAITLKD